MKTLTIGSQTFTQEEFARIGDLINNEIDVLVNIQADLEDEDHAENVEQIDDLMEISRKHTAVFIEAFK